MTEKNWLEKYKNFEIIKLKKGINNGIIKEVDGRVILPFSESSLFLRYSYTNKLRNNKSRIDNAIMLMTPVKLDDIENKDNNDYMLYIHTTKHVFHKILSLKENETSFWELVHKFEDGSLRDFHLTVPPEVTFNVSKYKLVIFE